MVYMHEYHRDNRGAGRAEVHAVHPVPHGRDEDLIIIMIIIIIIIMIMMIIIIMLFEIFINI